MGKWQEVTYLGRKDWDEGLATFDFDLANTDFLAGQFIQVGMENDEGKMIHVPIQSVLHLTHLLNFTSYWLTKGSLHQNCLISSLAIRSQWRKSSLGTSIWTRLVLQKTYGLPVQAQVWHLTSQWSERGNAGTCTKR